LDVQRTLTTAAVASAGRAPDRAMHLWKSQWAFWSRPRGPSAPPQGYHVPKDSRAPTAHSAPTRDIAQDPAPSLPPRPLARASGRHGLAAGGTAGTLRIDREILRTAF